MDQLHNAVLSCPTIQISCPASTPSPGPDPLVCHADQPLPLPASPTSAHDRLRRVRRRLDAPADPALGAAALDRTA